ncbi:Deoxyribonucleoside regulator [Propionicimonas sp. T2.31MG-18]|uniref:sugar-binding transcriptional regulator n=1 Tax=Propionicimonas sp. T2.31MG-18 TaxID=3157620 RepID=UPI0035E51D32
MSDEGERGLDRRREMIEVSRAYFLEDKSKSDIAAELGMSRFRVARLIAEAREQGVVTITVNAGGVAADLSERVRQHLNLQRAVVVEAYGEPDEVRAAVGRAAGNHLGNTLKDGELLGLAWGRTLTDMVNSLDQLPRVDSVQLTGSIGSGLPNPVIELVRKTAEITGTPAKAIFAPFFIEDARTAAALRKQPEVAEVLSLFDRLDAAIVAVGSLNPRVTQVLEILPPHIQELLLGGGAQAEICGIPFTEDGDIVNPRFLRHTLSVSPDQLRRTPRVIAAVAGVAKAKSVLSVCRSGMVNEAVMDVGLAQALLALPRIHGRPRS